MLRNYFPLLLLRLQTLIVYECKQAWRGTWMSSGGEVKKHILGCCGALIRSKRESSFLGSVSTHTAKALHQAAPGIFHDVRTPAGMHRHPRAEDLRRQIFWFWGLASEVSLRGVDSLEDDDLRNRE